MGGGRSDLTPEGLEARYERAGQHQPKVVRCNLNVNGIGFSNTIVWMATIEQILARLWPVAWISPAVGVRSLSG